MPPVPPALVMNLEVDPKEDPEEDPDDEEEDPSKDPMEDEDHFEAMDDQVTALEIEPMAEEPHVPRGARPVVIRTQPLMIRTTIIARGWRMCAGASSSRAPLLTPEDRDVIRE